MRKINENDYVSFTIHITRNGCNITLYRFKDALKEYDTIGSAILYGNKPNGERAILDSK